MRILSHRGLWRAPEERNTREAFARSFQAGFGVETDVRDLDGELVISHDPPGGGAMTFATFLQVCEAGLSPYQLPLALNIKSDGLQRMLGAALGGAMLANCFVFDMSTPDMIAYLKAGIPTLTRQSDVEHEPVCYHDCAGVWFDVLRNPWPMKEAVQRTLEDGKIACLVSPELHGRDHVPFWNTVNSWPFAADEKMLLCTDFPTQAKEFFTQRDWTSARGGV